MLSKLTDFSFLIHYFIGDFLTSSLTLLSRAWLVAGCLLAEHDCFLSYIVFLGFQLGLGVFLDAPFKYLLTLLHPIVDGFVWTLVVLVFTLGKSIFTIWFSSVVKINGTPISSSAKITKRRAYLLEMRSKRPRGVYSLLTCELGGKRDVLIWFLSGIFGIFIETKLSQYRLKKSFK